MSVETQGTKASGTADAGRPVKVGGKYNATPPTFTDGDRADLQVDVNGQVKVVVGAGGAVTGTEYTEDAVAIANPVGTMGMGVAITSPANEVPDADVVAQRFTRKGEAHTKNLDLEAKLPAALGLGGGLKIDPAPGDYETVAASQTDQMMGATGAIGDRLDGLLVIPATTSPGEVSIEDGSTNTVVFAGGATSVSNLIPFFIPFGTSGILSVNGGWEITTGANVSAIAFGQFT